MTNQWATPDNISTNQKESDDAGKEARDHFAFLVAGALGGAVRLTGGDPVKAAIVAVKSAEAALWLMTHPQEMKAAADEIEAEQKHAATSAGMVGLPAEAPAPSEPAASSENRQAYEEG